MSALERIRTSARRLRAPLRADPARVRRAGRLGLVLAIGLSGACAAVLGLPQDTTRPFEHKAHADKGVHCLKCHEGVELARDGGPLHLPGKDKCVSCHEKPHDEHECSNCHGVSYTRGLVERAKDTLRFDHAAHREKTKADCVRCHADSGSGATVMRPKMATCLTCHEHDAEVAAESCDRCHVDLQTEGSKPEDHYVHDPDFAEHHASAASGGDGVCTTCHAQKFCASCHAGFAMPTTPTELALDARGSGIHRANFMARHAEEAKSSPGLCTTCHQPQGCATCHEKKSVAATVEKSNNPHPTGWVGLRGTPNLHGPATWRDPGGCESCHGGAGEALCVGCHRVGAGGGNPHFPGIEPRGNPSAPPCVACHGGSPR